MSEQKKYELRKLEARDIGPMVKIINTVGVKNFASYFEFDENVSEEALGMNFALGVIDLALTVVEKCESDLFAFLASVAGVKPNDVKAMTLDEFSQLITKFSEKEELGNFIKAVSKLLPWG